MKAKELMIGDWVMINPISYYQIEQIRMEFGELRIYLKDTEVFATENEIMPIPITPEVLVKNGFEDIGDDTYQLEEKPYWFWVDFFNHQYGCEYDTSTYEYEDDEHRLKLYGIPSVHELQHAMRICGIEKEIEL